jgi:plastocyanin
MTAKNLITGPAYLLVAFNLLFLPLAVAQQNESAGTFQSHLSGEVRGKISISGKNESAHDHLSAALMDRYPAHRGGESAIEANPAASTTAKLSEEAVVYLESDELNHEKYPLSGKNPVLDQKDLQFHPRVLPILVGTTVDFPNRDNLFHNVFSYSEAKDFDLGRYPKNDSRSITFDKPGKVRVYCDIHSHMSATILVLQHPYFTTPNDDGGFVIHNVPEGKYRIVLWYDRDVVDQRSLEVKGAAPVEVDFTF